MSHHLDSPASRRDPRLNVTDVYAYGNDATVLTMIVNTSLAGAARVPGFHPEGRYEFKIHVDGAATEQLTYRFSFAPADASAEQHVAIDRLAGTDAADDRAAGVRIAEGHTAGNLGLRCPGLVRSRRRPVLPRPAPPGPHPRRTAE